MSDPVLAAQLAALGAQIDLLRVQFESLRQHLAGAESGRARIELPARCEGIRPALCALQSDDAAMAVGGFGDPTAWRCRGCDHEERQTKE
jgi:hypothetical protein